ncbi:tetratricopeptide repeat protein 7B-like isoform X2 [Liolophura sinensis]|uniref:tetratricopeptide repeat protein 7B-like isoform X2 n=1 Tax=Liolophura sinensis TaxID=3198878 RepID=UPI003158A2AE
MATKTKLTRLESELEKSRAEENWKKAEELARQLSVKSTGQEKLLDFIIGERKLETYLQENAPNEKNIYRARSQLSEAEEYLEPVCQSDSKQKLEAQLLMGKIHFAKGAYQYALNLYDQAGLETLNLSTASTRLLHIVAEAFAVKGLCLEKTQPTSTSKYKAAEREESILSCLQKAGDLSIYYLQEKERIIHQGGLTGALVVPPPGSSGTPSSEGNDKPDHILQTAIQRSPIIYIKNGQLREGIGRFRELLTAVESRFTQNLRQVLARQLAEVLLRGVCQKTYVPFEENKSNSETNPKPRKYSGDRLFRPRDENEETLLLLLISEAIATRDNVLNRSPDVTEARLHTFHTTMAVYDLLAIALVKRAQFNILAESFERAMRFSFDEFHIWYQFALALVCAGKHSRALQVLESCTQLQPNNPVVPLQAAKACYEQLFQYEEGIRFSEKAIHIHQHHPLLSRAFVSLGIGYSMKATEMKLQGERQIYQKKALDAFYKAYSEDSNDYLVLFHLAMQLAILRQIPDAIKFVKLALKLRSDHIQSLHLLVLLLTAQKHHQEAMTLLLAALDEYPDNLSLLLTKSKLEEVCCGPEEALITCKQMLELWKGLHEIEDDDALSQRKSVRMDRATFDRRSVAQLQMSELSERDSGSIRAESLAASRVEQALSEVASTVNSGFQPRPGPQQTWYLQAQIWLHLAELYLDMDKVCEAESCVIETSGIFPLSHQVAYMKGRVFEYKQNYSEAKSNYENAVSINPGHIKSLHHLGLVLHYMNNDRLAEKVLRDAVNADPTSHLSWYSLGQILQSIGHHQEASQCQVTAMELELTSPIVPFTVIPRCLQ